MFDSNYRNDQPKTLSEAVFDAAINEAQECAGKGVMTVNDNDREVAEARRQLEQERIAGLAQEQKNREALKAMEVTLQSLRDAKPSERNELARRYSVAITEYEKSLAFFKFYVVDQV